MKAVIHSVVFSREVVETSSLGKLKTLAEHSSEKPDLTEVYLMLNLSLL